MKRLRILINNSVPLNAGDEALLRATLFGLNGIFQHPDVLVLTSQPRLAENFIPDIKFDYDIQFVNRNTWSFCWQTGNVKQMIKKAMGLENVRNAENESRIRSHYRSADLILSSAGGYLNDYYDNSDRFATLRYIIALGKPVYLFGQSMGPFWKVSSKEKLKQLLPSVSGIYLRERLSLAAISNWITNDLKVAVTTDLAFLLYQKYSPLKKRNTSITSEIKIAMNFREWADASTKQDIVDKARVLIEYILKKYSAGIHFISTCQGIRAYVDDSAIAAEIVSKIRPDLREKCKVDREHRNPEQLVEAYSQFDVYIGMRLHGAILSMLGGTPALNISYERKTEGIFSAIMLDDMHFSYALSLDNWVERTDRFLRDRAEIQVKLDDILPKAGTLALSGFQTLFRDFSHKGSTGESKGKR